MDLFFEGLRFVHIAAGAVGLAVYWIPVLTKKGGKSHRLFGRVFKWAAYVVLGAAALSVSLRLVSATVEGVSPRDEPAAFAFLVFLGYLTLVTYVGLRHGLRVLSFKRSIIEAKGPLETVFAWATIVSSAAIIAYALYFQPPNAILLFALSPLGALTGRGILNVYAGRRTERNAWLLEHLDGMLGTGIAFHTAFAVFGMTRLFDLGITGGLAVVPWILPTIVGVPAIYFWTRKYQRPAETTVTA